MRYWLIVFCLLLMPFRADARSTRTVSYRYDQIWNTAVRFIRIDAGYKILEKDSGSGYIMFDYVDRTGSHVGSVEIVRTGRDRPSGITIGLRVADMPSYVEIMLLDKLERKLRDEYGDPPSRPADQGDAAARGEKRAAPDREETPAGAPDSDNDDTSSNDA